MRDGEEGRMKREGRRVGVFEVAGGQWVTITVALPWLKRWWRNSSIAQELAAVGFTNINVSSNGKERRANMVWPRPAAAVEVRLPIRRVILVEKKRPRSVRMDDDPLHDDATTAFLFQCGESDLFAVSRDQTGVNIPKAECVEGWHLREMFRLGVREPVPAPIQPEPILRGIAANGYFIWRRGTMHGTAQ
jgi:hypothetical protein